MSPAGVFVPEVYGVRHAGNREDTSIYYYGSGFRPETSIFLIVTGSPGVDDGPQTTYLYEGPSQAYLVNVLRTADLHDGKGTITGRFNVDCMYPKGLGRGDGWCKIGRMTTQGTTMVTTYNSTIRAQSTMTPVLGLVDKMRQSTATGIRDVQYPKTQSDADNAAYRVMPPAIATNPIVAALWTVPLALLVALLCL
ncbi:hypothetical protein MBRA1_001901 [Malassezia brasiliensis]|uniref:Uncharacterized protein n=1 Tax=Malassezia brasiliensis TaxID=1821822 RepID=A0AAF0DT83_9BASI|nr:hypothetical protein MBRA1_001901 [Malassezia brasiliensis]